MDAQSYTAADSHWQPDYSGKPHAIWKNLSDGTWYGPDPVMVWGRGAVCVFPQDSDNPIWVPEQLVCAVYFPVHDPKDRTEPGDQGDSGLSTEELRFS